MYYESDYILRLIEQMGGLVRRALEFLRVGGQEQSFELAEKAIALATDLDPGLIGRLGPESLAGLLEMRNLDDRVLELVAEALALQAEALDAGGEMLLAGNRRAQADAVRALLDPRRAN